MIVFLFETFLYVLQVLAASKNKLSSLKGFPHLPVLEVCICLCLVLPFMKLMLNYSRDRCLGDTKKRKDYKKIHIALGVW